MHCSKETALPLTSVLSTTRTFRAPAGAMIQDLLVDEGMLVPITSTKPCLQVSVPFVLGSQFWPIPQPTQVGASSALQVRGVLALVQLQGVAVIVSCL